MITLRFLLSNNNNPMCKSSCHRNQRLCECLLTGDLADGQYVIEVAGGSCSGKYLSYKPYGTEYPAVVRLKSAWANRKPVWAIRKVRPGVFTIGAQQRAKGYPAKLSYSFSDGRRPNVFLNDRGLLSWEILPQGRTGEYFIFTHVR